MKQRQSITFFGLILIIFLFIGSCQLFKPELKPEVATTPIRFGFSNWPGCAVWQVAAEQGIFEKNNIVVDLQFLDYTTGVSTLADNKLDGNCQTLYDTIYMLGTTSKVDLVIVALTDWSTGGDQIIVAPEIKTMQQLKGKEVAFEAGFVDHFFLLLGLDKYGLKPSDIKVVNDDIIADVALFLEEEVDGVVAYIPFVKEALNRPESKALVTSQDFLGIISDHIVVTRPFLETHPQEVQALVNSWFETVEFIKKNPDLSRKIIAQGSGLTVQDLETYESQVQLKGLSDNLTAFKPGETYAFLSYAAEKIYEFLQTNKFIDKIVNLNKILDFEFVRNYSIEHKKIV